MNGSLFIAPDFWVLWSVRRILERQYRINLSHKISVSNISWIWISAIYYQTTPMVQWLRIRPPVQGTCIDPWLGGFHMQLSPCTTTTESVLWKLWAPTTEPRYPTACAPQQVKPPQWEACAPQLESSHGSWQPAKAHTARKTQGSQKSINQ